VTGARRRLHATAGAAATLIAAFLATAATARASTVSFSPDETALKEATHVSTARITAVEKKSEKCVYTTTVTVVLEDPIRRSRPTTKPLTFAFSDYPYAPGCPGISVESPPRAAKLEKGARIVVALRCAASKACTVAASWDEDARPRLEKALVTAGAADPHAPKCLKVASKKIEELRIAAGAAPAVTKGGVSFAWIGAGHRHESPAFVDVSLSRGSTKVDVARTADEWSAWVHAPELGVCWRMIEGDDLDPKDAVLQVFPAPDAR